MNERPLSTFRALVRARRLWVAGSLYILPRDWPFRYMKYPSSEPEESAVTTAIGSARIAANIMGGRTPTFCLPRTTDCFSKQTCVPVYYPSTVSCRHRFARQLTCFEHQESGDSLHRLDRSYHTVGNGQQRAQPSLHSLSRAKHQVLIHQVYLHDAVIVRV